MPEQLALKVCDLVARVSSRGNWKGYSFVEDLQSRALLAIVAYSYAFDASKGKFETWALRCAWTWMIKELLRERKQAIIGDEFPRQPPPISTGPPPPARGAYLREHDAMDE
jgi:DNA-directed RNA polymerase specialized sigma subunit